MTGIRLKFLSSYILDCTLKLKTQAVTCICKDVWWRENVSALIHAAVNEKLWFASFRSFGSEGYDLLEDSQQTLPISILWRFLPVQDFYSNIIEKYIKYISWNLFSTPQLFATSCKKSSEVTEFFWGRVIIVFILFMYIRTYARFQADLENLENSWNEQIPQENQGKLGKLREFRLRPIILIYFILILHIFCYYKSTAWFLYKWEIGGRLVNKFCLCWFIFALDFVWSLNILCKNTFVHILSILVWRYSSLHLTNSLIA